MLLAEKADRHLSSDGPRDTRVCPLHYRHSIPRVGLLGMGGEVLRLCRRRKWQFPGHGDERDDQRHMAGITATARTPYLGIHRTVRGHGHG
jgi:hypothetical protein